MAEFRRLISYIYEYEGNVKGKNVGFVKLETRNGMCRLSVSVKKLFMGSSDMGVYLLTGRQEIFLGNIFLRSGCGEFRTMVQVADVQESGEKLDECYGLTLHGKSDRWRVYTTIWEDAVAQAAQLTLETITAENVLEREVERGKLSPVVPEASTAKLDLPVLEELPKKEEEKESGNEEEEELKKSENSEVLTILEPEKKVSNEADMPQKQLEEKEEEEEVPPVNGALTKGQIQQIVKRQEDWLARQEEKKQTKEKEQASEGSVFQGDTKQKVSIPDTKVQVEMPAAPTAQNPPKETKLPDFEMGQLEWETQHPDTPFGQKETAAPEKEEQEKGQPVIRQHKEEPLIIGDPEALAKLDEEEAMEKAVPVWDFFSKTYPKIQAFDSEHGCQILVIKPQDIGLLPREIWIYGNNSFLLHGYYNYRYLILARVENPKGLPRYLLGVPGHYYSNEKYMASMFGFPHFVLSKRQPAQDGRFGYWYTDIRMEENAVLKASAAKKGKVQGG